MKFLWNLMMLVVLAGAVAGCATAAEEVAAVTPEDAASVTAALGEIKFTPVTGRVGYPFTATAVAEHYDAWGIAGTPAISSGTLPPGITFDGVSFTGTPLVAGEWPLVVRFTGITADDGGGGSPDQNVAVTLAFSGAPAGPAFPAFQERARLWRELAVKPALPEEARRHKVLAEQALREENAAKAASELFAALRIDPCWAPGYLQVARVCGDLKRYEDALNAMHCYLELVPEDTASESCRDLIYVFEDKLAEQNRQTGVAFPPAGASAEVRMQFIGLLLEFEKGLRWEATADGWRTERDNWVGAVQSAATIDELKERILRLEQMIKWEAMEESWRSERDGWLAKVQGATTYAQLAKTISACEQRIKYSVQVPEWRPRREVWLAAMRGIIVGPVRLRK